MVDSGLLGSIDFIEMLAAVEDRFGIDIDLGRPRPGPVHDCRGLRRSRGSRQTEPGRNGAGMSPTVTSSPDASAVRVEEALPGEPVLDQVEGLFPRPSTPTSTAWAGPCPSLRAGRRCGARSAEKMLGRLGALFVAVDGDRVVGFAHGTLRKNAVVPGRARRSAS